MTRGTDPAIVITGLGKRYGRGEVLREVNLELRRGRVCGVAGKNGSGKSTLLALLAGFTRPTSGSLRLLGEEPGSPRLRGRVAVLPQESALPPGEKVRELLEHLALLQGLQRAAMREVAEQFEILDLLEHRSEVLSHGQQRRVALAAALLGRPEIVLLDEPTSGLDDRGSQTVLELLVRAQGTNTVLLVMPNEDQLARSCDDVFVLEDGRLSGLRPPLSTTVEHQRKAANES